jgi:hypothetical protein
VAALAESAHVHAYDRHRALHDDVAHVLAIRRTSTSRRRPSIR